MQMKLKKKKKNGKKKGNWLSYVACRFEKSCFEIKPSEVLKCVIEGFSYATPPVLKGHIKFVRDVCHNQKSLKEACLHSQ